MLLRKVRFGIGLFALAIMAPAAVGQVELLTQSRGFSHSMRWEQDDQLLPGGGSSSGGTSWRDFGPFRMFQMPQSPTVGNAVVSARNDLQSLLSVNSIEGRGIAAARLDVVDKHITARSRTSTRMIVGFRVDGPTRYRFAADASMIFGEGSVSESRVSVHLRGPKGVMLYDALIDSTDDPAIAIEEWGFLAPGEYEVHAEAFPRIANTGQPLVDEESGEFDVHLQMGCPADFNFDGDVTSQDFFDFLRSFFNARGGVDYTQDGVVNSSDFFAFLAEFLTGC